MGTGAHQSVRYARHVLPTTLLSIWASGLEETFLLLLLFLV